MPEHKISWPFVITVAVIAAVLGAGATILIGTVSPSTFTVFRGLVQSTGSTQSISSSSPSTESSQLRQTTVLEAGCTTTGLVLRNEVNGAELTFDAYSSMHKDDDGVFFILVKRAENFNFEAAETLFDGVTPDNIDQALGASIEAIATSIRDKCSIDTLYFDDRFFDSFLSIPEPDESSLTADPAASASLVAAATGQQWKEDPEGSFDQCMNEATSALQRLACRLKYAYYKTYNWFRDNFNSFRDFFRGKEGNDGGGRGGPPGGGSGGGGQQYQCSDWGSQKACTRNGCTWVEDPKSPSGGFCIS